MAMKKADGRYGLPPVRYPRWLSLSLFFLCIAVALIGAYVAVWRPGSEMSQFGSMAVPITLAVVGSYWFGLHTRR